MFSFSVKRGAAVALSIAAFSIAGCKSTNPSQTKDIGLSPGNLGEQWPAIWVTSDNLVHYALCPGAPATRNCTGIQETVKPVPLAEYKDKVTAAILNLRPKQTNSANGTYSEISALRLKLKRLETTVAAGGITAAETANLNGQIATLTASLNKLLELTPAEKTNLDGIIKALDAGQDVTYDEGEDNFNLAVVAFGLGYVTKVPLVPPGTQNNKMDRVKVLEAWNELATMFYGANPITTMVDGSTPPKIREEPLQTCIQACPNYWSELVCHYYCWHPSYKKTVPNIRACFTSIARDGLVKKPNGQPLNLWPEVFDYCMYQEYDWSNQSIPVYDEGIIAQRKASNRTADRQGVLKYMSPKQEDAFKYVMFNWYNPFAFDPADEQDILNRFYSAHRNDGSAPKVNRANKANHPRYTPILAYMQQQYASGALGPQTPAPATGFGGPATSCPPAGKLVEGYCWYQATAGKSCDDTCKSQTPPLANGVATDKYIGASGLTTECGKVTEAFGGRANRTYDDNCSTPGLGCSKCVAGNQNCSVGDTIRCTNSPTTGAAADATYQRLCHCE